MKIRKEQIADSAKNHGDHDKAARAEAAPIASTPPRRKA